MTIAIILQGREGAVFTASPDELVEAVVARLAEKRIGALPMVEGDRVIGIFSERDVIYGLASHGAAMMAKRVGDVMTAPAITVTSDSPVLSALSLMTRRRIRHLPEAEASAMRDYIQMA